jgi:hypothetical protein
MRRKGPRRRPTLHSRQYSSGSLSRQKNRRRSGRAQAARLTPCASYSPAATRQPRASLDYPRSVPERAIHVVSPTGYAAGHRCARCADVTATAFVLRARNAAQKGSLWGRSGRTLPGVEASARTRSVSIFVKSPGSDVILAQCALYSRDPNASQVEGRFQHLPAGETIYWTGGVPSPRHATGARRTRADRPGPSKRRSLAPRRMPNGQHRNAVVRDLEVEKVATPRKQQPSQLGCLTRVPVRSGRKWRHLQLPETCFKLLPKQPRRRRSVDAPPRVNHVDLRPNVRGDAQSVVHQPFA